MAHDLALHIHTACRSLLTTETHPSAHSFLLPETDPHHLPCLRKQKGLTSPASGLVPWYDIKKNTREIRNSTTDIQIGIGVC